MLDGLTANFGGTIGYFVASLLTSDPDRIAAATEFGATVGDAVGATGTVGPKKAGKGKRSGRKGAKKGGKKGSKKPPKKAGTGGSAKRVAKVDGPKFGQLKVHAKKHALPGQSTTEYYNAAVHHTKTGTRIEVRHDGKSKIAYVTRTGQNVFTFTSTTPSGGRIYTHMYTVDTNGLNNRGITLPKGF